MLHLCVDKGEVMADTEDRACFMQVSTRNRVLILFDWVKTRIFGRDLSVF